jgi:hypothetical protein
MKKTIILVFIAMALGATCQNTENGNTRIGRWHLGISASPLVCYRVLTSGGDSLNVLIDNLNGESQVKPGYSVGLRCGYDLSPRWTLETGVLYSDKGYTRVIDYSTHFSDWPSLVKSQYHYHYIGIPVKISYTMGSKRLRYFVGLSLVPEFLASDQVRTKRYYDDHIEKRSDPIFPSSTSFNLSVAVSGGIDLKVTDRIHLKLEPAFEFGLLKTTADVNDLKARLYQGGLNVGLNYVIH